MTTNSIAKEKLTILNVGSKTGYGAMQFTGIAKDLSKDYNVDLKIPGDYCVALKMLPSIKGPVLWNYSNDYEAIARDGEGCGMVAIEAKKVIRYDQSTMCLCSMKFDDKSMLNNPHTVAVTVPLLPFERAINAVNSSLGSKLKPVPYDGSGAVKTGLYNGEVDFAMLSFKHARQVIDKGGDCFYEFSDDANGNFTALGKIDPSNSLLIAGYQTVWMTKNMSNKQQKVLEKRIKSAHEDSDSAIYGYTEGGKAIRLFWGLSNKEITNKWETSVNNMRSTN